MEFRYHPDILRRYPSLCGGVVFIRGIRNTPTGTRLQELFSDEQRLVLERIGTVPLSELKPLAAWRQVFRDFGVDPTQYRSACEALLRRLTKKGDIPNINTLVDICNLVSIRYMLPVAAFGMDVLQGAITVCFAEGSEIFIPLGEIEPQHPEPGEVIFLADDGSVIARRWCWRQSAHSAAGLATTQAIITVEAQHVDGRVAVQSALNDLILLLQEYVGGEMKADILGCGRPSIAW